MNIQVLAYNDRQIKLMQDKILEYQQEKINLGDLISSLWSLITLIEDVSPEWKDGIWECVNDMEVVYACMLYDKKTTLALRENKRIENDIANIRAMIDEYKKEYPEGSGIDEEYEEYMRLYPDNNTDDDSTSK